jgi:hypothetical protein
MAIATAAITEYAAEEDSNRMAPLFEELDVELELELVSEEAGEPEKIIWERVSKMIDKIDEKEEENQQRRCKYDAPMMVEKGILAKEVALQDDAAPLVTDVNMNITLVNTSEDAKESESVGVIGKSTPSDDAKVTTVATLPDEATIVVTSLENGVTTLVTLLPTPL